MRRGTAGWRQNIPSASDILLAFWGGVLVVLFILFVNAAPKIPMDPLTLVTFMMAIAIWIAAIISLISTVKSRDMLKTNQQMLEEMRRSRPKPLVVASIERAPSNNSYYVMVKNKGRESARGIKVHYCRGEMPEDKQPGRATIIRLVDSPWADLEVMPLGPGETQKFKFPLMPTNPSIAYFKFEVTYSDGVESYKETYQTDVIELGLEGSQYLNLERPKRRSKYLNLKRPGRRSNK